MSRLPLRLIQPWFVLLAALGLTFTAALLAQRAADAREQTSVVRAVEEDMRRLQARLDAYLALLKATRAFVDTQGARFGREAFRDFVSRLPIQRDYPGIQGVGWTPRLDPQRIAAFEAAARAQGLDGFRVHPSGPREPMFSILYLEPLDERNRAALGYDMSSEPVRWRAMAEARDEARPALTGRVTLRQEIDRNKQAGFLIYVPLYAGGSAPATVAARRESLVGFVYAPFRATDFFGGLFGQSPVQTAVRIYAGPQEDDAALLYQTAQPADGGGRVVRRVLKVGDQGFTLVFTAPSDVLPFGERLMVPGIALIGGAVSLLLFLLVRAQARARDDLERSSQAVEQALVRERSQRQVAEALSGLALALGSDADARSVMQRITDEATRLTGAAFGAYFENQPDDAGAYGLYTLAGAPAEAFSGFPAVRATPLFAPTFRGETVRLDDVKSSPLYGRNPPHDGMPPGHLTVTSYLAVAVRTRGGRVLGALLLGHPEAARFTAEHARLVEGLAAQAAIVLDHAALLQQQRDEHARTAEQKALLDQLIDQSGEGIIMADAQGVVRVYNPAAQRQHGVGVADVSPQQWAGAYGLLDLDGQPLPLAQTPLYRALHGESVHDARWQVRRPDGTVCVLAGTATPLRRPDGELAGAVLISRDETDRLRAEQEREALLEKISRSNRELDQFAYVASHDLKAPLRGIANLAQWIEEDLGDGVPDGVAEQLRLLRGRVGRMESLIDGILLYSRAGRTAVNLERVDVGALLRETVELLAPPPGVEVVIEAPQPSFTTDRVALQQVFMNLIGNAVKHAAPRPAEGQGARVVIRARDSGRLWTFSVSDNGPGIAPAYHERIWGLFQTLEARDKVEGTGIGLSIVRKAAEAHGGRAWVESAEGEGATFFFTWSKEPQA